MKQSESIFFDDKSFPIKISEERTSFINNVESVTQALHEAIEIKYFYEGESTLLVGTKTVHAGAGDVIVINPYEVHATIDYGKAEKGKYHLIMVGLDFFNSESLSEFNLRNLIFGKRTVFKTQFCDNTRMQEILTRVTTESRNHDISSRLLIFGLMAEFFAILMRDGVENQKSTHDENMLRYYAITEPAIRMIRDDYSRSFTIDDLAKKCNVSKFHFCRIFKAVMGIGAIQYLNEYRLKIADAMLANTNKPIGEVALLCGFEDQSYFTRIYKKYYGHTPKNLKKFNTGTT